jgi:hypothetical protein
MQSSEKSVDPLEGKLAWVNECKRRILKKQQGAMKLHEWYLAANKITHEIPKLNGKKLQGLHIFAL